MINTLSHEQKSFLKKLAHNLKPVVLMGNHGLTEGVIAEIEAALSHHELIKIKVSAADRETKELVINAILRETKAHKVQSIGNILTIYRFSEQRKITLPRK